MSENKKPAGTSNVSQTPKATTFSKGSAHKVRTANEQARSLSPIPANPRPPKK